MTCKLKVICKNLCGQLVQIILVLLVHDTAQKTNYCLFILSISSSIGLHLEQGSYLG